MERATDLAVVTDPAALCLAASGDEREGCVRLTEHQTVTTASPLVPAGAETTIVFAPAPAQVQASSSLVVMSVVAGVIPASPIVTVAPPGGFTPPMLAASAPVTLDSMMKIPSSPARLRNETCPRPCCLTPAPGAFAFLESNWRKRDRLSAGSLSISDAAICR